VVNLRPEDLLARLVCQVDVQEDRSHGC
jgi:hypothetical protein